MEDGSSRNNHDDPSIGSPLSLGRTRMSGYCGGGVYTMTGEDLRDH